MDEKVTIYPPTDNVDLESPNIELGGRGLGVAQLFQSPLMND
jgi:hypothetical protein